MRNISKESHTSGRKVEGEEGYCLRVLSWLYRTSKNVKTAMLIGCRNEVSRNGIKLQRSLQRKFFFNTRST